jgi:hypothetical protein
MSRYTYRKPVRRSRYSELRLYTIVIVILLATVGAVIVFVISNTRQNPPKPVSKSEDTTITDKKETFTGPYFQFQDTGKWSFDKNDSTSSKFVYLKYQKNELQHQLNIYVNQVPIPLNLATPRVLPVRIVNNNSLDVTDISQPCGSYYGKDELHKVKELNIEGATMLCDPDNTQYYVMLSEINGDYRLGMLRPNKTPIQFVITYKELGLEPQPESLLNVASTFQAE